MKKITIKIGNTVAETFEDFIISRKARGLSDKTLTTYNQHFKAIGRHLDVDIPIDDLTKTDLESMVLEMSKAELAQKYNIPPFHLIFLIQKVICQLFFF